MNDCKLILATTYQDEDNKFYMKIVKELGYKVEIVT